MAWIYLFVAGVFETAWAIGLKYSDGFTKLGPSIFTFITMLISLYLLSLALRMLPVAPDMQSGLESAPSVRHPGNTAFDESRR
jgi:hypothetical protein